MKKAQNSTKKHKLGLEWSIFRINLRWNSKHLLPKISRKPQIMKKKRDLSQAIKDMSIMKVRLVSFAMKSWLMVRRNMVSPPMLTIQTISIMKLILMKSKTLNSNQDLKLTKSFYAQVHVAISSIKSAMIVYMIKHGSLPLSILIFPCIGIFMKSIALSANHWQIISWSLPNLKILFLHHPRKKISLILALRAAIYIKILIFIVEKMSLKTCLMMRMEMKWAMKVALTCCLILRAALNNHCIKNWAILRRLWNYTITTTQEVLMQPRNSLTKATLKMLSVWCRMRLNTL